jgi:lysophospholipase L1-like esterase
MSISETVAEFAAEAADPHCLSDDAAVAVLSGSPYRRFAVLGDSLAKGLGDDSPGYRSITWATRVASALRGVQPDLAFLNLGRPDLRAAEVLATQLEPALEFRPDLASVICGGMDLLVPELDLDLVKAELDSLAGALRGRGADIVMFTLQDISTAWPELAGSQLLARVQGFNDVTRSVAARHGGLVVEMWSHPARSDRSIYSVDMRHASMKGQAIVAAATITVIGEHLATLRAQQSG